MKLHSLMFHAKIHDTSLSQTTTETLKIQQHGFYNHIALNHTSTNFCLAISLSPQTFGSKIPFFNPGIICLSVI